MRSHSKLYWMRSITDSIYASTEVQTLFADYEIVGVHVHWRDDDMVAWVAFELSCNEYHVIRYITLHELKTAYFPVLLIDDQVRFAVNELRKLLRG